jgi:hypothetical protein
MVTRWRKTAHRAASLGRSSERHAHQTDRDDKLLRPGRLCNSGVVLASGGATDIKDVWPEESA